MRNFINIVENISVENIIEKSIEYFKSNVDTSDTYSIAIEMGIDIDDYEQMSEYNIRDMINDYATDACNDAYYMLRSKFSQNGKIIVWRVITAPADWKPDQQPLGPYWAWNENAAEAHWGSFNDGHIKWVMCAELDEDQIDWPATIAQNADPSYADEREIRVATGKIHLLWYQKVDDKSSRVSVNQLMETETE